MMLIVDKYQSLMILSCIEPFWWFTLHCLSFYITFSRDGHNLSSKEYLLQGIMILKPHKCQFDRATHVKLGPIISSYVYNTLL